MSGTTDRAQDCGTAAENALRALLAPIQAKADLEVAKGAAGLLTRAGLSELRAWIDLRLATTAEASAELSERESEVMRLIALGYSNKEIAARLKVSVKSVETYKTRAQEKLGIRSRTELVQYAVHRGWIGATEKADRS